jgi:predicted transcriptional regulator YdeE
MKIVKYIFLLLLLAAVAFTVFVATQAGSYDIQEEKIINIPRASLFNYVNDYSNWNNITILADTDTTTVYTFSDTTSGPGAYASWKTGENEGEIKTLKVKDLDSIIQSAAAGTNTSKIYWTFKDTLNTSTKVKVRLKGNLSFTEKAYALLKGGTEQQLESALENGLQKLKTFLTNEINNYAVAIKGKAVKNNAYYIGYPTTSSINGINQRVATIVPRLLSFVKTNNMGKNGVPFVVYDKYDRLNNSAAYTICIPLKEEIFTAPGSEFVGGELKSFTALKTTLNGDYSHLKEAWNKAYSHIAEKQLELNTTGQYVEVYSVNMQQTRQPSKWVTDIYFPIGKPADTLALPPVTTEPLVPLPAIHPTDAARQRLDKRTSARARTVRDTTL